jgi:hypothetical protein
VRPFLLIETDSEPHEVLPVGMTSEALIIVPWLDLEFDPDEARAVLLKIKGRYDPGETPSEPVKLVLDRLQEILGAADEDDEPDDDEPEDDDE